MSYNDNFNPADNMEFSVSSGEFKNMTEGLKKDDKGYNVIWRMMPNNGKMKKTKIEIYTSSGHGCHIRDAETGEYHVSMVGTNDEDLYFSVVLATGECKSKNGSSTLFYLSPHHYMKHFNCELEPSIISSWEEKRQTRLRQTKLVKRQNAASAVVK